MSFIGSPSSRGGTPGGRMGSRGSSRSTASSLSLQIAALADTRRGLELHASAEALDSAPRDPRFHNPVAEARWDNTSPICGRYVPEFGVKKKYNSIGQLEEHVRRPASSGILPPAGGARGGPRVTVRSCQALCGASSCTPPWVVRDLLYSHVWRALRAVLTPLPRLAASLVVQLDRLESAALRAPAARRVRTSGVAPS